YVTHDQSEALALSDRIAVMRDGVIEQIGTPQQIYHEPRSRFVATFVGRTNMFNSRSAARADGGSTEVRFDTELGYITGHVPTETDADVPFTVAIRPENVGLRPDISGQ